MTGSWDCRSIRHALGVYVLGAIDPAERAAVDIHLGACPDCREELAGLAGLPALLRRVPVADAQQLAEEDPGDEALDGTGFPAEEMLDSLLGRMTQRRRVQRWRGLAAAAAAVILVAGAGGATAWGVLHHPGSAPASTGPSATALRWESVSASDPQTSVAATVRYASATWGTVLDTAVTGIPVGTRCQLEVTDSDGHTTVVGGWTADHFEGSAWYPGSSAVMADSVRSFEITSGGKVLVTVGAKE